MTASRATTARLVQILAATLAALVGAYLLGWAWRWPTAIVVGMLAIYAVTDGQREACGTPPACDSLLPGL